MAVLQTLRQFGVQAKDGRNDLALPKLHVKHPEQRLDNPDNLCLGVSRIGTANNKMTIDEAKEIILPNIPVHISHDRSKIHLPIFGNQDQLMTRLESRASTLMTSSTNNYSISNRLSTSEIEQMLWDKMRVGYFAAKNLFKSYDPEGRTSIARENLHRVLCTLLAMRLTFSQFNRLMKRIGFEKSRTITFDEFYKQYRRYTVPDKSKEKKDDNEYPSWLQQQQQSDEDLTANQVHTSLKEKAKNRFDELLLIMDIQPGDLIIKPVFSEQLKTLGYPLKSKEFEKLWQRYDSNNTGAIGANKLREKLGVDSSNSSSSRRMTIACDRSDRQQSIAIEKWLAQKFKHGFNDLYHGFKEFEMSEDETVSREEFCSVLRDYGLIIHEDNLDAFLTRCSLPTGDKRINYNHFLRSLQESNKAFNVNPRADAHSIKTNMSSIMVKLGDMLHGDYARLLNKLRKIDHASSGKITVLQFQAILESFFDISIAEEHFVKLLKTIPKDENGNVLYEEFMNNLHSNEFTSDTVSSIDPQEFIGRPPATRQSTQLRSDQPMKSINEITALVKDLLRKRYREIEQIFYELDDKNTKRMTKLTTKRLLERVGLKLSSKEIDSLWTKLMMDQHGLVEFTYFIRHFGYSLKSAAFPNSKINPPLRGDADFRILSQRFNSWKDLTQDLMKTSVQSKYGVLIEKFQLQDINNTGIINSQKFKETLGKVCDDLTQNEINMVTQKISHDNKVNWKIFMKHLQTSTAISQTRSEMVDILKYPQRERKIGIIQEEPIMETKTRSTSYLRDKITPNRWKELMKLFPQYDHSNKGYVTIDAFRNMLRFCNVTLNHDETVKIITVLDDKRTGMITLGDLKMFYEQ